MSKLQLLAGLAQLLAGSISLLYQLLYPRLELFCRRRLFRPLVVGAGCRLISKVTFQVRLLGLGRCKRCRWN
jgi:hypothetical protein